MGLCSLASASPCARFAKHASTCAIVLRIVLRNVAVFNRVISPPLGPFSAAEPKPNDNVS